jgi:hypothetical protein
MMRTCRHALIGLAAAAVAALVLAACGGASHPASSPGTATGTATTGAGGATTSAGGAATTTGGSGTATTPGAGAGVTYGIGDAPGWFARCTTETADCCNASAGTCRISQTAGYFDSRRFLDLTTPASAHRVSDVRLFVEYDAAQQWNGSTTTPGCEPSRVLEGAWNDVYGAEPAGDSLRDLIAGVIEARADGLQPVVAIAGYPFSFARPAWDAPTPDPTTVGGYWEYRCGVQGILDALSRLPAWEQPHAWEAMNEPDGFGIFKSDTGPQTTSCAPSPGGQPDGAAKAACDEVVASHVIHGFVDHGDDTVMAGTFKHLDPAYLAAYAGQLGREMGGAGQPPYPATWSVHDYRDVDQAWNGARATALATFDRALAHDTGGRATSLWITEAGTVLTSRVKTGNCPAVGVDASGTLGACINGSPGRQAAAAAAFFSLPRVASAVPITHLFWYQFESAPDWDSGLLDTARHPRAAYCAFLGYGLCDGSPDAPSGSSTPAGVS